MAGGQRAGGVCGGRAGGVCYHDNSKLSEQFEMAIASVIIVKKIPMSTCRLGLYGFASWSAYIVVPVKILRVFVRVNFVW